MPVLLPQTLALLLQKPQVGQRHDFAGALVANDPQFHDVRTEWDFWLVTTEMTLMARAEAKQSDRRPGLIWDINEGAIAIRVWLRSWSEIIKECEDRLHYFKDQFEHDPSVTQALEYLNFTHRQYLPIELTTGPDETPDSVLASVSAAPRDN
ncbi:hypothetical protein O7606_20705 [Micromonospora sp. WMMD882]|uniref:hypothetical protein n=1 Tax=Micromonospora sp. WMMD882 TaxID=3015151 RepID=UPI00248BE200|nr:hypothetical protein [Micromonospora sp. WMMD882]WBB78614.1 hypothetical protein O7606_20705 [Micromonospora sp. WMMD882]